MKRTLFALVGAMLLLTACNTNDPTQVCPVAGRTYVHINEYGDTTHILSFGLSAECDEVCKYIYLNDVDYIHYFYTMSDTTITLFYDKRHKKFDYYSGTLFYHDTTLIRVLDATDNGLAKEYVIYEERHR